jgi:hypothetical protein
MEVVPPTVADALYEFNLIHGPLDCHVNLQEARDKLRDFLLSQPPSRQEELFTPAFLVLLMSHPPKKSLPTLQKRPFWASSPLLPSICPLWEYIANDFWLSNEQASEVLTDHFLFRVVEYLKKLARLDRSLTSSSYGFSLEEMFHLLRIAQAVSPHTMVRFVESNLRPSPWLVQWVQFMHGGGSSKTILLPPEVSVDCTTATWLNFRKTVSLRHNFQHGIFRAYVLVGNQVARDESPYEAADGGGNVWTQILQNQYRGFSFWTRSRVLGPLTVRERKILEHRMFAQLASCGDDEDDRVDAMEMEDEEIDTHLSLCVAKTTTTTTAQEDFTSPWIPLFVQRALEQLSTKQDEEYLILWEVENNRPLFGLTAGMIQILVERGKRKRAADRKRRAEREEMWRLERERERQEMEELLNGSDDEEEEEE